MTPLEITLANVRKKLAKIEAIARSRHLNEVETKTRLYCIELIKEIERVL